MLVRTDHLVSAGIGMLACAAIWLGGCAAQGRASPAEHDAIVATVNRLFEAMESKDEAALREVLDEDLALVAIDQRDGSSVSAGTRESFVRAIVNAPATVRERMWDPEVRVDGDLATLWAPYELWLDDRFSHCGVDSVQLVRSGDGWRIVSVAYTRRLEGCDPGADPQ